MLKIILQILIFTLFIFGNGYQSLITTFMIEPMKIPLLQSIDELFESDYEITVNTEFINLYSNNSKFQKALKEGRINDVLVSGRDINGVKYSYGTDINIADIISNYKRKNSTKSNEYKIPEAYYSELFVINTGLFDPFVDEMQTLMILCYEAGLPKKWKNDYEFIQKELLKINEIDRFVEEEKRKNLNFNEFLPICVILLIGHGMGGLVLLVEIFYNDFLRHLNFDWIKWKRIFKRRT